MRQHTINIESSVINQKAMKKNSKELIEMVDLRGLIYRDMEHPTILVGLPKPYVNVFNTLFCKPGEVPPTVKKATGNLTYVSLSRAVDVYKVCRAMDGKTLVHQDAVTAVMNKLEKRYGKEALEASLRG